MREKSDIRYTQIGRQIWEGMYGSEVQQGSREYEDLSGDPIDTFLKVINDFYDKDIHPLFRPYPIALIHAVLSLYFKNYEDNLDLAETLTVIFQRDIDGTSNTCIKDKYLNMLDASHASKQSIGTNNRLIVWELAKNSFLAYNEFLNVLIGAILINYRFSIGKSYRISTLQNAYGNKVNELKDICLANSEYTTLMELMKPEIRNAIGHQSIWFNSEDGIVTYFNDKLGNDETITIKDFIFLTSKASYLGEAYIVALSTIGIFTIGSPLDKAKLPKELFLYLMDIISPAEEED